MLPGTALTARQRFASLRPQGVSNHKGVFMLRMIAIAAMLALALPSLAVAQQPPPHHPPGKPPMRSGGGGPPPGGGNKAFVRPGPGAAHVGPMAGPHGGGPVGA